LCQSYISVYAVLQPCNHATLCYSCGKLEKETETDEIVSNNENNNGTGASWSNEVDEADKIKKCLVCDEKVETVQKVKHGSGSLYKCPADGCYFSCQNSLTELLEHIKMAKHFRQPEENKIEPRKVPIQKNVQAFQIQVQRPVQRPVQVPVNMSVQKQCTIQNLDQINQKTQNTKNQLQNPFQDENGQMYYK
jgi:hypothetical protein